jgi:hypothetical protein
MSTPMSYSACASHASRSPRAPRCAFRMDRFLCSRMRVSFAPCLGLEIARAEAFGDRTDARTYAEGRTSPLGASQSVGVFLQHARIILATSGARIHSPSDHLEMMRRCAATYH